MWTSIDFLSDKNEEMFHFQLWFCERVINNEHLTCHGYQLKQPQFGETEFNSEQAASL